MTIFILGQSATGKTSAAKELQGLLENAVLNKDFDIQIQNLSKVRRLNDNSPKEQIEKLILDVLKPHVEAAKKNGTYEFFIFESLHFVHFPELIKNSGSNIVFLLKAKSDVQEERSKKRGTNHKESITISKQRKMLDKAYIDYKVIDTSDHESAMQTAEILKSYI